MNRTKSFYLVLLMLLCCGGIQSAVNPENPGYLVLTEGENLIKNANFSLVRENTFSELYGWTVYDSYVDLPRTGGLGASSATAEPTWTKFANAKGSVNLDGEENKYSTAATFVFPEYPNNFCASTSVYVYGDSEGYELLLEPNRCYKFGVQLGYLNPNEKGSVEFRVVNKATDEVVKSVVYQPTICVSDTFETPEYKEFVFTTSNSDVNENYKLVIRNYETKYHWTMVMSNLSLYKLTDNLIYNPNFSLVDENVFGKLYGWTIYDSSVEYPLTGGIGASSATVESTWKRFDNAGEGKKYSTAATFVFPEKANYFCSSKSEYVYGDSEGYELLLEPNSNYVFKAQVGYLSEGKKGSVEFSVVNKATDRVVISSVFSPSVCVSDTTKVPESFVMIFKTDEALDAENYKIVLKNANPNNYWTMVMSNLCLVKYPLENDDEPTIPTNESADTVKVDIATPNTASSENTTTPVVTENKDGEKCYVYNPEDETKNQTVSFTVPVETVAAGNKYYVVIDLVPTDEARIRATYYSFGLKGMPHKTYTRPSTPADGETSVLGSYLYTGDKEERLVFEFTLPEDMDAVEILISTQNPAESASDCTSAIGLKQVSLTTGKETKAGNNATTAIEIANNQKQVVPTEIYTMSGVKVSSLQKGINIIRFSDGTIKKVMY